MADLYRLIFPNGKSYIGVAGSARARFLSHCSHARKGGKLAVHCAIRKYGEHQVKVEVISSGSQDFMYTVEPLAIAHLQTLVPNGYNMTIGGDAPPSIMPDVKEKIRQSKLLHWQDPEYRARMVAGITGMVMTEEQNQKNSEAKRRHWADPNYRAKVVAAHSGKIQSEETRKKRSESLKRAYAEGRR